MTENDRQNLENAVMSRKPQDITLCFDMDGVICKNNGGDYENAPPIEYSITNINRLYDLGYKIIIFTARFGQRFPGRQYQLGYEISINWLRKNNVKFHEFHMGKPHYDMMVDDKGVRVEGANKDHWQNVWDLIEDLSYKNQYGQLLQ